MRLPRCLENLTVLLLLLAITALVLAERDFNVNDSQVSNQISRSPSWVSLRLVILIDDAWNFSFELYRD